MHKGNAYRKRYIKCELLQANYCDKNSKHTDSDIHIIDSQAQNRTIHKNILKFYMDKNQTQEKTVIYIYLQQCIRRQVFLFNIVLHNNVSKF